VGICFFKQNPFTMCLACLLPTKTCINMALNTSFIAVYNKKMLIWFFVIILKISFAPYLAK